VSALTDRDAVHAVVLVGATSIATSDVTIEAIQDLCTKELPGFGGPYADWSTNRLVPLPPGIGRRPA
jgi:molybdopterin biosynthesis enzyme MoaB